MSDASYDSSGARCVHCGDVHPPAYTHCPKTGKALAAGKALIGRIFADRYRVLGLLGEGGMGAVYVAEHLLIGRKVALKRLHPELAADAKAVARFQREARAAAATGHENIVEILDLGYAEDGAPFLVMEYLKGQSLAQTLRAERRLAPARACHVVGQVLAALAAVHRQQIVHRDLKPDNVFLTRRSGRGDYVKVLDFGISKMRREEDGALDLTKTGVMLGTPFYMSPEQARGMKDLDHRVDLYATGVILYECLTGKLPFEGANYHALLQAILRGQPTPVREYVAEIDAGLAEIVNRSIAKDPNDRFQTTREMLLALVPFGAQDTIGDDPEPSPSWRPGLDGEDEEDERLAPTTPGEMAGERADRSGAERHAERGAPGPGAGAGPAHPAARASRPDAHAATAARLGPAPGKRASVRPPPRPFADEGPASGTALRPHNGGAAAPSSGSMWLGPPSGSMSIDESQRAPRPRALAGPPRPFVATSDDWVEGATPLLLPAPRVAASGAIPPGSGAAPVLSSSPAGLARGRESRPGEPAPVATTPARPSVPTRPAAPAASVRDPGPARYAPTPPPVTPFPTTPHPRAPRSVASTGDAQVKGSLLLATLEHVEQAHGRQALERLVNELVPEIRSRVTGVILPVAWFPLGLYDALLGAAEATLGTGDGAIACEIGAATAARDLPTTHRLFMQSATPAMALERIPVLWKTYHSRGEALVEPVPTGGHRVTIRDLEPETYLHAMAMSGFYRQLLTLAGARDVRSTMLSSRGRGDEKTITALRWR